jgi:hypothetical protein
MLSPSQGAVCARHPESAAVSACSRCGRFCCEGCSLADQLCGDCLARGVRTPPSKLAMAAALVGLFSLFCGFAPGLIAIGLAQWELARIRAGTTPVSGRAYAHAGQVIGGVALLIGAVVLVVVLG